MDFDINESLKLYLSDPASIHTPDAAPEISDLDHDGADAVTLSDVLDPIRDSIHENPDALMRSANFDTLQCLLKNFPSLPGPFVGKILDIVTSGLSNEADITHHDVENDEQETIVHHRQLLEMYGFLLQWSISAVETKAAEKSTAPARKGAKGTKKTAGKDGTWDSTAQVQTAMDVMCRVMKLKLTRIFSTNSDRDTFINLFTRSIYLIMESEARMKVTSIRMFCFKVLCIAIKHNGHALGAQTSIIQNLTYFEHLSEPMAELLHILSEQYDHSQLASEVLRELSSKDFSPTDAKGPKAVSAFVTKLSELEPRLVGKELGQLARFLDSEAYTLRCAIIEVCGNLLADLSKLEEQDESTKVQINAFFDVLEQRFLDTNPYCRCRAMQVFIKVCNLDQKYPKRRQNAAELAVQSLQDKSSNVRRNAVKLLGKLVSTHPFSVMHGGELSMSEWEGRLEAVEQQLTALQPPPEEAAVARTANGEEAVDSGLLDEATRMEEDEEARDMSEEERLAAIQKAEKDAATAEVVAKLKLTRKYYIEALKFLEIVHEASDITCQLLSAKNKSEVIEAMDFFVIIDAFKVEVARKGIRRMLRLIWTKGNSDEGKGVQTHLIDCYKGLFFDAPETFNPNDAANFIARNMISLTFGASPAELTSLEQLLATMLTAGHISPLVIAKLWQVYGVNKDISKAQRRGAIIVLGMIATADPSVVAKEVETMLRVGLGTAGRKDLILARYTCVALRRMIPPPKKAQDKSKLGGITRMPNDNPVLGMLASILLLPSTSRDWYGMAEQAISAIYALSEHPDVLCSEVLRMKTKKVFSQTQSRASISRSPSPEPEADEEADAMEVDEPEDLSSDTIRPQPDTQTQENNGKENSAISLSQLLFVVGHVAVKQIVHLELCELDFKRRKQEQEKDKPVAHPVPEKTQPTPAARRKKGTQQPSEQKEDEQDELDLIGGTTEDDFTEAMSHIRERELLYGRSSILALFGPLVTEICANNTLYRSRTLQSHATLCLAKLMCVSSEYCEANLPLLITILERSPDPIVRSNAVIALGDMAVCFNHLIDENTDFLYRRLQDPEESVKRTCLMTLTFLILAGQVKVKGQLGEMAKCLEDADRKISDLSRMFFTELATKDNAVYNQFVDMFSILTQPGPVQGGVLEEDALKRILKFLCGFVEKDRHARNLAEKLGARLGRCENERQWNDTAFALGLLAFGKSEEIERRVKEGYRVVTDGVCA